METIYFAKVKENAIIPTKEDENAGYDIYGIFGDNTDENRIIRPHTTKLIPTGIACALPQKYYFQVEERGSTGSKGIKKSAGVIDSGYRGEIFIAITNSTNNYLVFGEKESYINTAYKAFEQWQSIDPENLTQEDKDNLKQALENSIGEEEINSYPDSVLDEAYKSIAESIVSPNATYEFTQNLENAMFYPDNKAIAQLVLHEVPVVTVKEITYQDLQEIPSKRKNDCLGSTNK